MLQDTSAIRHYQKITDSLVNMSERGYRTTDEMRLFLDGYLSALRFGNVIEVHHIHRLEEEVIRFVYDSSNFASPYEFELEIDRGER
jgi:hypothetical protein